MFKNVLDYYNHLAKSMDEADLARIFPDIHALSNLPPKVAVRNTDDHPKFELDVETAGTCSKCKNGPALITKDSVQSLGCNWNCVSVVGSKLPLCHMKFVEIVPIGKQVGIGFTSNPYQQKGFRFCNENGGVYLDSMKFYFGEDSGKELSTDLSSRIESMPFRFGKDQTNLGLAIDYEQGQLLLKWPNREGVLSLDLPEKFRGCLLFPKFQAWNGCSLRLSHNRIHPNKSVAGPQKDNNEDDVDDDAERLTSERCLANLLQKDVELNAIRQKLELAQKQVQELSLELNIAQGEKREAKLQLEVLQANMELESKNATLEAERSATVLFEEAEQRMMGQHRAMLKQLTKAATAVATATQALIKNGEEPPTTAAEVVEVTMPTNANAAATTTGPVFDEEGNVSSSGSTSSSSADNLDWDIVMEMANIGFAK